MADADLRVLERYWLGANGRSDGLAPYVAALARSGAYEEIGRIVTGFLSDDAALDVHGLARELFVQYSGGLRIEDRKNDWVLSYIAHDGRFVVDEVDKRLIDGGELHTQEELIDFAGANGRSLQSLSGYTDMVLGLYERKDHGVHAPMVAQIRDVLCRDLVGRWTIFGSRVMYRPVGQKDLWVPNWGPGAVGVEVDVVGPSGCEIKAGSGLEGGCGVTMGSQDVGEIGSAYGWLCGKKAKLWRFA